MARNVHFEERTGWAWWAHVAVSLAFIAAAIPLVELAQGKVWGQDGAMSVGEAVLSLCLGLGIPGALYSFLGQLRVRVLDEGLELAWGLAEVVRKTIPFSEIERVEPVTYSPLAEFGGWGIRGGLGKKRAWTVRGNRALRLHLSDGALFYLGSRRPERLLGWVQSVGKNAMRSPGTETGNAEKGST